MAGNNNDVEHNKKLVMDFMNDCWVANNVSDEVLAKYTTENFIAHNPVQPDGRNGWKVTKDGFTKFEVLKIIAENEFVVVHGKCDWRDQPIIFIDIWRIENGLLAEHWDAINNVPRDLKDVESANPHPYI